MRHHNLLLKRDIKVDKGRHCLFFEADSDTQCKRCSLALMLHKHFSFFLSVNSPLPSRGQDGLFLPEPPPAEDPYFCFRVSGFVRVNVKA